jgi:hypothetical protein
MTMNSWFMLNGFDFGGLLRFNFTKLNNLLTCCYNQLFLAASWKAC